MADRRPEVRELSEKLQKQHPNWSKSQCESVAKYRIIEREKSKHGTI